MQFNDLLDKNNDFNRGMIEEFEYTEKIPNELKSDIIFERPDVLKVERELERASIDIRVARKEFLPSFKITGLWIVPSSFSKLKFCIFLAPTWNISTYFMNKSS